MGWRSFTPDAFLSLRIGRIHMDRLKILITNSTRFLGGAEKWAWNLGKGLLKRGHDVSFAVKSHSELARLLLKECRSLSELPMRGDADPYSLLTMIRLTRTMGTDVVVTTCERDFRLAGLATKLGGRGRVVARLRSVCDADPAHNRRTIRFYRRRLNYNLFAARLITNSDCGKRDLMNGGWVSGRKVELVYNGVDLTIFNPARVEKGALRRQFGIPQEAVVIALIARIAKEKGQLLFVDAADRLLEEYPHTYFLIVGEPTSQIYFEGLLHLVRTGSSGHHIVLTGFRDDVERVLADTDVLLLPSIEEGLPNVVIEAMAMERPVVATNVGATNEVVEDGINGYLIPFPIPMDLLLERLGTLIERPELRERMGREGRRTVEEKFDFEKAVRAYEQVLFEVKEGSERF